MAIFFAVKDLLPFEGQTTTIVIKSIISGLIAGIVAGAVFGLLIGVFSKTKPVPKSVLVVLNFGEEIIHQTNANHCTKWEGVGGRLYLTRQRVIFKSNKFNIRVRQFSISLAEIKNVSQYRTLGIINNGLMLETTSDGTEKFIVADADQWIFYLQQHQIQTNLKQTI